MMISKAPRLVRRYLRARKFGVKFTGTTGFNLPSTLVLGGKPFEMAFPENHETGYDFINLALDDDYGLKSLPFEPRNILDVGANVGMFSMVARHFFPSAVIHAYEPNPRIFPYTAKNLMRIETWGFNAGLGSRDGFAEMLDDPDSRQARTKLVEAGPVRIDSIQQAIERLGESVDLMKLDCEGAEWDIFSDVAAIRKVRVIRMEYHLTDGKTHEDIRAEAKKLGFRIDRTAPSPIVGLAWLTRQD
jgi:FkbM family methyltransferase